MDKKRTIIIYTDGACFGNPGPGGYAAVLRYGERTKQISGGFRLTTNNRMEIKAVIEALKAVKSTQKYKIKIYTDSKLIVNAFNQGWLLKWKEKSWMRNRKEKVLNPDLWQELLMLSENHELELNWVEGHTGIPDNELCDKMSKEEASKPNLPSDDVYEHENGLTIF
jgi:ribonuclease HI